MSRSYFSLPRSAAARGRRPRRYASGTGFRPAGGSRRAPQWLTILRLVGAGLGVTIAPACAGRVAMGDVVCRKLRSAVRSDVELAYRVGEDRALVRTFCEMARQNLA